MDGWFLLGSCSMAKGPDDLGNLAAVSGAAATACECKGGAVAKVRVTTT